MPTFQDIFISFSEAVDRLAEALAMPKNTVTRDSAIKRFELVFELAWKTIKAFLEEQGISCTSPKACFQDAYKQELIDYEEIWLEMIKMRNETVHTYNEKVAETIFARLPDALEAYKKLLSALRAKK